jgi:hypothetical protein
LAADHAELPCYVFNRMISFEVNIGLFSNRLVSTRFGGVRPDALATKGETFARSALLRISPRAFMRGGQIRPVRAFSINLAAKKTKLPKSARDLF